MATGKQWSDHFREKDKYTKEEVIKAINILLNDEMFSKYYGRDFKDIRNLIEYPLS